MARFEKIVRPVILSILIGVTAAVGDASGCDENCPWDGAGDYTNCWQHDLGPGQCWYDDMHYYWTMGGC